MNPRRVRVHPSRTLLAAHADVAVQCLDAHARRCPCRPETAIRDPGAYSLVRVRLRAEAVADLAVEARDVELAVDRAGEVETHVAADAFGVDPRVGQQAGRSCSGRRSSNAVATASSRPRRASRCRSRCWHSARPPHGSRVASPLTVVIVIRPFLPEPVDVDVTAHGAAFDVLAGRLGAHVAADGLQPLRAAHALDGDVGADGVDRQRQRRPAF